jgi:hypothetical protein
LTSIVTATALFVLSVKVALQLPVAIGATVHVPSAPLEGAVTVAIPPQVFVGVIVPDPPVNTNVCAFVFVNVNELGLAEKPWSVCTLIVTAAVSLFVSTKFTAHEAEAATGVAVHVPIAPVDGSARVTDVPHVVDGVTVPDPPDTTNVCAAAVVKVKLLGVALNWVEPELFELLELISPHPVSENSTAAIPRMLIHTRSLSCPRPFLPNFLLLTSILCWRAIIDCSLVF